MRRVGLSALMICMMAAVPVGAQDITDDTLQSAAPDWRFSLRPYLFFSGLSGSVTAGPLTFPINSKFSELLDNLQLGGFIAFAAEKGRWGGYLDFQYISLVGKGSSDADAELELENLIVEADATLRPGNAPSLKFLAGVRVYTIGQTLTVDKEPLPKAELTVLDPVIGAQGEWTLSDRWDFEARGDIGGFGVSSEFTYQLMLLFRWDVGTSLSIPFGYRVLGYQIKTDEIWMNTRMGGLVLGVDILF